MWSSGERGLGERYHALFGFMQGVSMSVLLSGIVAWGEMPARVSFALVALNFGSLWVWRRSWRKWRAAYQAETRALLAECERLFR
jgi:hypothetical protein